MRADMLFVQRPPAPKPRVRGGRSAPSKTLARSLRVLKRCGPQTTTERAVATDLTGQAAISRLRRCEASGWVEKIGQRRGTRFPHRWRLTASGQRVAAQ